jgi:hypothetical protein
VKPLDAKSRADPGDVREALRLIHESGVLGDGRLSLLFNYLIEEELAGRGDRLKAYSIAIDVFNRGEDFDPSIDSLVRVEMLRLRRALGSYRPPRRATPRATIKLVKGSYRPAFYANETTAKRAAIGAARVIGKLVKRRPVTGAALGVAIFLLALLFLPSSSDQAGDNSCSRPSLSLRLNGFSAAERTELQGDFSEILQTYPLVSDQPLKTCLGTAHRLELTKNSQRMIQAALYRAAENNPYWVETFLYPSHDVELSVGRMLYSIASPGGVLVKDVLRRSWPDENDKRDFLCHVNSYAFFTNWTTENPSDDLSCLRSSMRENSSFSDTYSLYALYAQIRYFDTESSDHPRQNELLSDYRRAMDRALSINPTDCLALIARMREYRRADPPDTDRLHETAQLAEQHCGNNPFMLNHLSTVEGFAFNEWPRSLRLSQRSIAITGLRHEYAHSVIGNLFASERWREAHDKMKYFNSILNSADALWFVIIGNRANDPSMLDKGKKYLAIHSIRSYSDVEEYVMRLGYHPDVSKKILKEVEKTFR